jgi:hypothetical protein
MRRTSRRQVELGMTAFGGGGAGGGGYGAGAGAGVDAALSQVSSSRNGGPAARRGAQGARYAGRAPARGGAGHPLAAPALFPRPGRHAARRAKRCASSARRAPSRTRPTRRSRTCTSSRSARRRPGSRARAAAATRRPSSSPPSTTRRSSRRPARCSRGRRRRCGARKTSGRASERCPAMQKTRHLRWVAKAGDFDASVVRMLHAAAPRRCRAGRRLDSHPNANGALHSMIFAAGESLKVLPFHVKLWPRARSCAHAHALSLKKRRGISGCSSRQHRCQRPPGRNRRPKTHGGRPRAAAASCRPRPRAA